MNRDDQVRLGTSVLNECERYERLLRGGTNESVRDSLGDVLGWSGATLRLARYRRYSRVFDDIHKLLELRGKLRDEVIKYLGPDVLEE